MKLAKDLLYDKENKHLDIARFSALVSVLGYVVLTGIAVWQGIITFDPLQWGSGWAAICGGNAAWIFARQRYEAGVAYNPEIESVVRNRQFDEYERSPRYNDPDPYNSPRLL